MYIGDVRRRFIVILLSLLRDMCHFAVAVRVFLSEKQCVSR